MPNSTKPHSEQKSLYEECTKLIEDIQECYGTIQDCVTQIRYCLGVIFPSSDHHDTSQ